MLVHKVTSRDEFIVAQALSFSIKVLSTLPAAMRPKSNISEMKAISRYRAVAVRKNGRCGDREVASAHPGGARPRVGGR
jgi:hypothetical protein